MRIVEIASICNSKTWQFFENLRNFANLFIFKFDNQQTSKKFYNFENYQIFIIKIFLKFTNWKKKFN